MRPVHTLRSSVRSRRGATLLMFVMLVFAFLAIAGVAIDVGMASLTQQEMQVAVDTASLEGMRLRQAEKYLSHSDHNIEHRDRRVKASRLVQLVFDDDLFPTGIPASANDPQAINVSTDDADTMHFGAGPAMQAPGPMGNQHISVAPESPVWDDPKLRWNTDNKAWGDMVSGTYLSGPDHSEDVTGDYARTDFDPAAPGALSQARALAFLVRMRRTDASNPRDKDLSATYFSRSVPFLFSVGALIQPGPNGYDPRRQGMTLRATAIAVARPALRASPPPIDGDGLPIPNEGQQAQWEYQQALQSGGSAESPIPMLGLYPFALSLEFWTGHGAWPGAVSTTGAAGADGMQGTADDIDPTFQGNIYLLRGANGALTHMVPGMAAELPAGQFAEYATVVGSAVLPMDSVPIQDWQRSGYVAIYEDITGPSGVVRRIVGYGFCQARESESIPGAIRFSTGITHTPDGGEMTDAVCWVGTNGVSARFDSSAPELTEDEWNLVLERNRFLVYGPFPGNPTGAVSYDYQMIRPGSLLAATLAR